VLDYYWQSKADLAHYARACVDILFKFPFGTDELEGIAARGAFDLTAASDPLRQATPEVFDEEFEGRLRRHERRAEGRLRGGNLRGRAPRPETTP